MSKRSTSLRLAAVGLCLSMALAAALKIKDSPAIPAAKSAEQILAEIERLPSSPAIERWRERARKAPNEEKAWLNLGNALAQGARDCGGEIFYAPAQAAYERALQSQPRNPAALTGLAWVYGARHLFDQSVGLAKQALEIDPANATAYGLIGDAEVEAGDYKAAFDHYQKMIDLRPNLSSYSRGAYLLWLTGRRANAISLMQRAVRAGAPYAENAGWCRAKLAMMLFEDGALLPAWQTLEPALAAAPENVHVLLAAGQIMTARHDYVAAIQFYRRAIAVGPNIEALAAIGDLYALQDDKTAAEECYRQVEALHTTNLSTGLHDHMQMARFYADHERNLIEALRMAEQFKLTRNVLQADTLGWVYFKNGELDKANEAIDRALTYGTLDPSANFHAGMIAAKRGDVSRARRYLVRALTFNPEFSPLDAPLARKTLSDLGPGATLTASGRRANLQAPGLLEKLPSYLADCCDQE